MGGGREGVVGGGEVFAQHSILYDTIEWCCDEYKSVMHILL